MVPEFYVHKCIIFPNAISLNYITHIYIDGQNTQLHKGHPVLSMKLFYSLRNEVLYSFTNLRKCKAQLVLCHITELSNQER